MRNVGGTIDGVVSGMFEWNFKGIHAFDWTVMAKLEHLILITRSVEDAIREGIGRMIKDEN